MRHIRQCFRVTLCVIAVLQVHLAHGTAGQPGTLDLSFNGTGKVLTPIGTGNDLANAVAVQPDGKLVLAGLCNGSTNFDFCALRYNTNGTLDASFGSGGKVITSIGTSADNARAVAVQPDGKLVLAGSCTSSPHDAFCALRYNTNGTLDTSFGSGGKVITAVGTSDAYAVALALQPDGKLVLAGFCDSGTNFDFCALRYNANGTLDASFGGSGTVITPVGTANDYLSAVAVQPDGKLVLAGFCDGATNTLFCALRYNANGTLDVSFGSGGTVTTLFSSGDGSATALVLQPDSKLVLAGGCVNGAHYDFCALRYNTTGALDASFGTGGKVVTPVGASDDYAYALALQPDGKLVLAGNCSNGTNNDFCAVRYDGGPFGNKNCSLDIDGDGLVLAATDSLIHARVALGITGPAVVSGITFAPEATRKTWPLIRDYLVTQCGMSLVQ